MRPGPTARDVGWPAWVNGRLVPTAEAAVSVHDRGFRGGDGAFTTIRARLGPAGPLVADLDAHVAQLRGGLAALALEDVPAAVLTGAVAELLDALAPRRDAGVLDDELVVRLSVTPGPVDPHDTFPPRPHPHAVATVVAVASPFAPAPPERTAATVRLARPLPTAKSLSYAVEQVALRRARTRGADTAVLVDADGALREGATANVALVTHDQRVLAPAFDGRVLPGTTLPWLLRAAETLGYAVERTAPLPGEVRAGAALLLTSSVGGVVEVTALDGVPPCDDPDPASAELLRRAAAGMARAAWAPPAPDGPRPGA